MTLPVHDLEVDGVRYKLRRMGPFDALRFDAAGSKMLGPFLRALSLSDNAKGFLAAFSGADEAKVEQLLGADVGAAVAMLGIGLDEISDKLDADTVIDLAKRMFIGRLTAPHPVNGLSVEIGDADTYEEVIGLQMATHGHMHQLKLLWAALRANLGPTSAGSPPSTTTPKVSPA